MRRVIVWLLVGLGCIGVAGGLALASGGSSAVQGAVLGGAGYPAYPDVAADGSLGFDAVWTDSGAVIMTAHLSATTGQWSSPEPLSGRVGQAQAQVAGSASGAAAAVWDVNSGDGSADTVQASYRPSTAGGWQPRVTLARSRADWRSTQVAVDGPGDAFAAWIALGRGVVMAEHPAGASSWSKAVTVEPDRRAGSGELPDLALAVSPAGTMALVWERYLSGTTMCCKSPGTRNAVMLAVRPAGRRSWLPRLSLGIDGLASGQPGVDPYSYGPHLAINQRGTVVVASQWPHAGQYRARAVVIAPTDRWGKPRSVALPGPGLEPAIAMGAHDFSTILWESTSPGGTLLQADLSPTARIVDRGRVPGGGSTPQLASDAKGDIVGAWGAAVYRPAGRRWCPSTPLHAASEGYSVAIAPNGVGQVIWDDELDLQAGHGVVRARTLTSCRAR